MSFAVRKYCSRGFFVLAITLLCFSAAALAQSTEGKRLSAKQVEEETQAISDSMMSPFCPGRTISACPSPQARDLRTQIAKWLTSGYSPEGVRKQLQTIYGEDVRGVPQETSFGLLGWWGPALFVVFAFLLVWRGLRRMRLAKTISSSKNSKKSSLSVHPELVGRIENQVKERLM